jgi:hypothetical protein
MEEDWWQTAAPLLLCGQCVYAYLLRC